MTTTAIYRTVMEHRLSTAAAAATTTTMSSSTRSGKAVHSSRRRSSETEDRRDEPDNNDDMVPTSDIFRSLGSTTSTRTTTTTALPQAYYTPSTKMLEQHVKDDTLLRVKICFSIQEEETNFYLPVALLVDRELEMRKTAASFGIDSTRWQNSLLFREWRNHIHNSIDGAQQEDEDEEEEDEICIVLYPEHDNTNSLLTTTTLWEPWLTSCIRAYYNTGTIRIPDACVGSDILLALEYFGILYSPNQLIFESFGGYLRVKMWSDYFTHRAKIADWVLERLCLTTTTPNTTRHTHSFVTSPYIHEQLFFLNSNKPIDVLDGDLMVDPARYGDNSPSRAIVHDFFNDDEQEQEEENGNYENHEHEKKMNGLMRNDFCSFLQASLPGTHVSFSPKLVTTSTREEVQRAVLRIHLGGANTNNTTRCSSRHDKKTGVGLDVSSRNSANTSKDSIVSIPSLGNKSNGSPVVSSRTASTLPITPSTFGDVSVDQHQQQPHFLRRAQTDKSYLIKNSAAVVFEHIYEEQQQQPHDEFTPIQTPTRCGARSPWGGLHDEPSVDHPRENIQHSVERNMDLDNPTEFVRSLSEKIIRKTLADMDARDTIDHHHNHGQNTPPAPRLLETSFTSRDLDFSNTPSDEAGFHGMQMKLAKRRIIMPQKANGSTSDDDDDDDGGVKRNLLPTLETLYHMDNNNNNDRGDAHAAAAAQVVVVPNRFDSYTPPFYRNENNAPLAHVRVNYAKPCDASVLSALSNPTFHEPVRQTIEEALTMSRQQSFNSYFRTTVDALSLADEQSVRIEEREEKQKITTHSHREASKRATSKQRPRYKVEDDVEEEDDDEMSINPGCVGIGAGCVATFYDAFCADRRNAAPKRKNKTRLRGKDSASEGTLRTEEETDCEDESGDNWGRKSGEEAIDALGTMATSLVDGILENLGAARKICASKDATSSKTKKTSPKRKGHGSTSKKHTTSKDWNCSPRKGVEHDDDEDATDDIISKLSNKTPQNDTFRKRSLQSSPGRKSLPPRPTSTKSPRTSSRSPRTSSKSPGKKQNRTPVRTAVRPQSRTAVVRPQPRSLAPQPQAQQRTRSKSHPRDGDKKKDLNRIEESLKKLESRATSKRRTESVMKNLELLKDVRETDLGAPPVDKKVTPIKIVGYDKIMVAKLQDDVHEHEKKRVGGRMSLLSFGRRKK